MTDEKLRQEAEAAAETVGLNNPNCVSRDTFITGYLAHAAKAEGLANELRAEVERLKSELAEAKLIISGKTFYDEVAAERERAAKLVDALDWAFQGIEHFTTDEDQGQVKFLRDGIWKTVAEYKGGKA